MKNSYRTTDNFYVGGSVVPKYQPYSEDEKEIFTKVKQESVPNKEPQGIVLTIKHIIYLSIMTIFCVSICFSYVSMQNKLTRTRDHINTLKSQVNVLQSQNDSLSYSLKSYMNTTYIIKTANSKLGMKQAKEKQLVKYKQDISGYTIQYSSIPQS